MQLLKELKSSTGNTSGGTDIQAALIDVAAAMIKEANRTGDKTLSRANVLLMTDGGSDVDLGAVRQALQAAKGKDTQLLVGFIAIDETNPVLMDLAKESAKMGVDKSMYIHWTAEDMAKVNKAAVAPAVPLNDFWTKSKYSELPREIQWAIQGAAKPVPSGINNVDHTRWFEKAKAKLESSRRSPSEKSDKDFVLRIEALRFGLKSIGDLLPPTERVRILNTVIQKNDSTIFIGRNYSAEEIGVMTHMLGWVKGES